MNDFDAAMLARLRASSAEAGRVVLDLVKSGRKLPDAVADAVETLPWLETSELRRWAENWEAWCEWQRFKKDGWKIDKVTPRRVLIDVPSNKWRDLANRWLNARYGPGNEFAMLVRGGHVPSNEVVAAAADVGKVEGAYIVEGGDPHSPIPVRFPYGIRFFSYDVKRRK